MGSPIVGLPLERVMLVSYRLPIVTIALSLTVRLQFAIEYLRRLIKQGGGATLSQNFRADP